MTYSQLNWGSHSHPGGLRHQGHTLFIILAKYLSFVPYDSISPTSKSTIAEKGRRPTKQQKRFFR